MVKNSAVTVEIEISWFPMQFHAFMTFAFAALMSVCWVTPGQ